MKAVGDGAELGAGDDEAASGLTPRRLDLIFDTELSAEIHGPGLVGNDGVRAPLHGEAVGREGLDHPTHTVAGFEQRNL